MRFEFDATLDDTVEAQMNVLDRSSSVARQRMSSALLMGALVGLLLVALLPGDLSMRMLFGAGGAVVCAAILILLGKHNHRDAVRAIALDMRETDQPLATTLEFDESGIRHFCQGVTVACAWNAISDIAETRSGISIVGRGGVTMFVPKRVFRDRDEIDTALYKLRRLHRHA